MEVLQKEQLPPGTVFEYLDTVYELKAGEGKACLNVKRSIMRKLGKWFGLICDTDRAGISVYRKRGRINYK